MSGGHFNYEQYKIGYIVDDIEQMILNNEKPDNWGWAANYSPETIAKFKEGIEVLKKAQVYAQRIDWLVSGDDGEDSFHERLADNLAELELEKRHEI